MPEPAYSDAQIDAAVAALSDPERLREAQSLVARAAPGLQRVLAAALHEGGWFQGGQDQAVRQALGDPEPQRAMHMLLAEETRLGMLVGVTVGFELARELGAAPPPRSQEE